MIEDDVDRLIRKLRQKRNDLVDILIKGMAPAENVPDGYHATAAKIQAFNEAIDAIKEELANWAVYEAAPRPAERRQVSDPAGY